MYDVADSAFTTVIVTALYAPYFSKIVVGDPKRADFLWGIAASISELSVALLAPILGAIADFCDGAGVDQVRIVQCDAAVTGDETISPGDLSAYAVHGFGGSDLSPAMLMLADDPDVRTAVIITDGDIAFPAARMPYDVLWVMPRAAAFNPPYGRVIAMDGSRP